METSNSHSHQSGYSSYRGVAPQPSVLRLQSVRIALHTQPIRFDSYPLGFPYWCTVITYLVMSDDVDHHSWWTQLIKFALNIGIQTL
eukprot:15344024-Ditylum_brightwellii.AAC.1